MFYGGGTRDKANIALCNVATDYWMGWCLLTTFFQTCSTTAINLQACWVFLFSYSFFSSSFINSKWAWQRFDNVFLIPTSQVEPTCSASPNSMTLENCNLWQVSQFHEVEAVSKKGGTNVALKFISLQLPWHEKIFACYPSSMVISPLLVSNKVWSTHLCKNCF